MIVSPPSLSGLSRWMRGQEQRVGAVEGQVGELRESVQFISNLLALSPYAVRLPSGAERDDRLRAPSRRIPFQRRPKLRGHL